MSLLFPRRRRTELRTLDTSQADACAALHATSFAFPWPQADFETLLTSRTTFAEGAYGTRRELIGFILSRLAADEAEILTIAITPRWRRNGIAKQLLEKNGAQLIAAGAKTWFLEVEEQNTAANRLYRNYGFVGVGERTSYYRSEVGAPAKALILRKTFS